MDSIYYFYKKFNVDFGHIKMNIIMWIYTAVSRWMPEQYMHINPSDNRSDILHTLDGSEIEKVEVFRYLGSYTIMQHDQTNCQINQMEKIQRRAAVLYYAITLQNPALLVCCPHLIGQLSKIEGKLQD